MKHVWARGGRECAAGARAGVQSRDIVVFAEAAEDGVHELQRQPPLAFCL
jgi:hypothetical protein